MKGVLRSGVMAAPASVMMTLGSGLGGAWAPAASATEVLARHHVAEDPAPADDGPTVTINEPSVNGPTPAGAMSIQPAGQQAQLDLHFRLGGKSTYSNVHFSTSAPGSAPRCPITTLPEEQEGLRFLQCVVNLPVLKAGEKHTYSVTMTGQKDGKPFSVSDTTVVWAPDVSVQVLRDGKDITGTTSQVTLGSRMEMVVTNRSGTALTRLSDYVDEPPYCTIASVPAKGSGRCSFTFGDFPDGATLFTEGPLEMWDLSVVVGDAGGWVRTPTTKLSLVEKITETAGTSTTPATSGAAGTARETAPPAGPSETGETARGSSAPAGSAGDQGSSGDQGPSAESSDSEDSGPLSTTGMRVGLIVAIALALLGLGGGALLLRRHRS